MADNTNPNANSEESDHVLGETILWSINEPGVSDPLPFKIAEDENVTTTENLELAYPEGYVPPE